MTKYRILTRQSDSFKYPHYFESIFMITTGISKVVLEPGKLVRFYNSINRWEVSSAVSDTLENAKYLLLYHHDL